MYLLEQEGVMNYYGYMNIQEVGQEVPNFIKPVLSTHKKQVASQNYIKLALLWLTGAPLNFRLPKKFVKQYFLLNSLMKLSPGWFVYAMSDLKHKEPPYNAYQIQILGHTNWNVFT